MSSITPADETTTPAMPSPPEEPGRASGKEEKQKAPKQTKQGAPKPEKTGPGATLGTWGIVLGILGIIFALIPHASGFGIFLAAVGVFLGGLGLLRHGRRAVVGTSVSIVALVLSIIFLHVYSSGASTASAPAAAKTSAASASTAAKAPAAKAKAAAPAGTAGELQALVAAKGYLADGQGFSQAGLLGQLTSSSGNGFAQADAQWAVAHAGADWNAQALKSAKNYLSDGQGFSQASLTGQLTSADGGQFTAAQAQSAVANSGADWNAQAVTAAKGYMTSGIGFSRASLIQQLTSPDGNQFTEAQAEYAAGQVGLK